MGASGWSAPARVGPSLLLAPSAVCTRAEALAQASVVPKAPGVYGWYFDALPSGVPTEGVHASEFGHLLYVGIAPRRPRASDSRPSQQHLRSRIRSHFRRRADSSTLRLTLGSLLADELDLRLQTTGNSGRFTFGAGEAELSNWMSRHARVAWVVDAEPWLLEAELISSLVLPLNLDQNRRNPFRRSLAEARRLQRELAREST